MKYIDRIYKVDSNNEKGFDIKIDGKNLIITGRNGSGKTSLIKSIYEKTELLVRERLLADLPKIESDYQTYLRGLSGTIKGTSQHESIKNLVENTKKKIHEAKNGVQISINNNSEFYDRLTARSAVLRLFEATRAAKISHADTARGIDVDKEKNKKEDVKNNFGSNLEQHLVNIKNRRSLAITEDGNTLLAERIDSWLKSFASSLSYLMEDDSMRLDFNASRLKFMICQSGKNPYTFQNLSSGYSAILDIYADLIMRSEYFETIPEELTGVVFIDEIDAHLHVSLQRLIMPFFEKSFPNVQFIVTTHSPFILMSVNDAVIYDVSRREQIDDDLSFYSYSAVMEGVLGVSPNSRLLEDAIKEIAEIANSKNKNIERLKVLLERVDPAKDKLNDKAKAYYLAGKNVLADSEGDE